MFERFTREARAIVTSAVEEAELRGDSRVGTEHLLVAAAGARSLGGTLPTREALRDQLNRLDEEALRSVGLDPILLGTDHRSRPAQLRKHLPFTGAAKEALKGALKEAIALGHRHIGAEHIALALTTAEPPDRALAALEGLDMSRQELRSSILRRIEKAS
ncbi:MAG TPA: Clp protease N-terminal domain-containing protein [Acidimicrobiia bacterium]|nr:Clp protease N-terminal domain-containing protein [Acidimicrobiia bacterium]